MRKIIYEASKRSIQSLKVDGMMVGVAGVIKVEIETDCGLWTITMDDGNVIHSTGNVFIYINPTS
jgi:hypothetical protein